MSSDLDPATVLSRMLDDEPAFFLAGQDVRRRATSVRRRRRATTGVAGALAAVAVLAALAARPSNPDATDLPSDRPTHFDPDHLTTALEDTVADIPGAGAVTIEAIDGRGDPLTGAARGSDVIFWNASAEVGDDRFLRISLAHETIADVDPQQSCDGELAGGVATRCTVRHETDTVVLDLVRAVRRQDAGEVFPVVLGPRVASIPPGRLWFQHRVVTYRDDGVAVTVNEYLRAPDLATADATWLLTESDIATIADRPDWLFPTAADDGTS